MAELQPLTDELTCSICLEVFGQPVTTPCGHNFCSSCLDETWTAQSPRFFCPQCRACFQTRPQLKKNTVLCAVVEQLRQSQSRWDAESPRSESQDGEPSALQSRKGARAEAAAAAAAGAVLCDYCLQAPAAKTCLTCLVSFCQEHLRPHLDNPTFQGHRLQPPVGDLSRLKCPEHGRLREFFCRPHGVCICCVCLAGHKTCPSVTTDVALTELKYKMKQKLTTIYDHFNKASSALNDVKLKQHAVQETAARNMDFLKHEFEELKALIESEEKSSLQKLKEEEKRVLDKYDNVHQVLLEKKREIESVKEEIELLFTKYHDIAFLEKALELQELVIMAVDVPKNELDQEVIHRLYQNVFHLKMIFKHEINNLQEKKTEEATNPETTSSSPVIPLASNANPVLDSLNKMRISCSPQVLTDQADVAACSGVPSALKPASPPSTTGLLEPGLPAATASAIPTTTIFSQASLWPGSDDSTIGSLTPNSPFAGLTMPPLSSINPASAGFNFSRNTRVSMLGAPIFGTRVSAPSRTTTNPTITTKSTQGSLFGTSSPFTGFGQFSDSVFAHSSSVFRKPPSTFETSNSYPGFGFGRDHDCKPPAE
ncbi:E3 ubiquitin/ISG15 ligase TRIM25-like [Macrotis lagotis]|uniref:E3 ubiquitin/ISG15 ligase TRIM25-like n=1 Tax=Macrotis lagotis TaxID=92651 RepID=UPI003D69530A